jgi:hypothetical protein
MNRSVSLKNHSIRRNHSFRKRSNVDEKCTTLGKNDCSVVLTYFVQKYMSDKDKSIDEKLMQKVNAEFDRIIDDKYPLEIRKLTSSKSLRRIVAVILYDPDNSIRGGSAKLVLKKQKKNFISDCRNIIYFIIGLCCLFMALMTFRKLLKTMHEEKIFQYLLQSIRESDKGFLDWFKITFKNIGWNFFGNMTSTIYNEIQHLIVVIGDESGCYTDYGVNDIKYVKQFFQVIETSFAGPHVAYCIMDKITIAKMNIQNDIRLQLGTVFSIIPLTVSFINFTRLSLNYYKERMIENGDQNLNEKDLTIKNSGGRKTRKIRKIKRKK